MADFENKENYGYQFVNKDGATMIVPPLDIEAAIKRKQEVEELKRKAKEEAEKNADIQEAEFEEVTETPKESASVKQEQHTPDAMTLVRTNQVIQMSVNNRYVRFEKLYVFIRDYFVSRVQGKYDWFALYAFLSDKGFVTLQDKRKFSAQMSQPEWFGYLDSKKLPSADAMGDYNYLSGKDYRTWSSVDKPTSSKASTVGISCLVNHYINLATYFEENVILEPARR